MKLELFGKDQPLVQQLSLLAGGYDVDHGRVTVVVQTNDDRAGLLTLEVSEARRLATILLDHTPEVGRVEADKAATAEVAQAAVARMREVKQ